MANYFQDCKSILKWRFVFERRSIFECRHPNIPSYSTLLNCAFPFIFTASTRLLHANK